MGEGLGVAAAYGLRGGVPGLVGRFGSGGGGAPAMPHLLGRLVLVGPMALVGSTVLPRGRLLCLCAGFPETVRLAEFRSGWLRSLSLFVVHATSA